MRSTLLSTPFLYSWGRHSWRLEFFSNPVGPQIGQGDALPAWQAQSRFATRSYGTSSETTSMVAVSPVASNDILAFAGTTQKSPATCFSSLPLITAVILPPR